MIMQTTFRNIFHEKIFEMLPTQNTLRYLPQRDQKSPGIKAIVYCKYKVVLL